MRFFAKKLHLVQKKAEWFLERDNERKKAKRKLEDEAGPSGVVKLEFHDDVGANDESDDSDDIDWDNL